MLVLSQCSVISERSRYFYVKEPPEDLQYVLRMFLQVTTSPSLNNFGTIDSSLGIRQGTVEFNQ